MMVALASLGSTSGLLAAKAADAASASSDSSSAESKPAESKHHVGIDGHYRVGRWVGIRTPSSLAIASIETRDGDGVQVEYTPNRQDRTSDTGYEWTYVIPGSEAAPLVLRGEDDGTDAKPILSTRLPTIGAPSRGPAMIPLSMPWVLVLGDPMGIDQIGVNRILDRDASIAVTLPKSPESMPESVLGLDGIDMIVINAAGSEFLGQLNLDQQQALADWVIGGGKVFVTLGQKSADLLRSAPWLREQLPVESIALTKIDPASIETYTSSQTPLKPFDGVRLPKDQGEVLILGRNQRRISTPVAVRYSIGFGTVTVVVADLETPSFAAWPERLDLISRLTGSTINPDELAQESAIQATAYNDLAGQTRAILDRFPIQRQFKFSVLSLAVMALIAAIGPLDYFLINRVFGKPMLGWISFPVMAIGLSVLLASQSTVMPMTAQATDASSAVDPDNTASPTNADPIGRTVRCNRIEIVDVDTISQVGRGYSVNYLYTHEASLFDIAVTPSAELNSIAPQIRRSLTAPFGYPGEPFGGIQISIEDSRLPIYQVLFQGSKLGRTSSLRQLPLAPRSSKGFLSDTTFTPELTTSVEVQRRPGSELLQGGLVNPLPFDLLNGKLVFRNWAYILPTRLRAGERIPLLDKLRQKNFRWLLSRQKALESSTETQAWDPTSKNSMQRIAEMLMFHNATGGSQYTNLENSPLAHLDLSQTLGDDRCILFGSVDKPLTSIQVSDTDESFTPTGDQLTMIRVILPVTTTSRR
ncbi:hypothetical protein K227x_09670 [Rubripirellula lacrimiformis]|uniref:CHASE2 domain protein n=2 Tax=Rubripirellula lacrimiformis TaxID=1930273 RepID=A0A517N625_9BACT|nr:hypothetical protein K227x_09670 [Rubripirellula lacrimiformis]